MKPKFRSIASPDWVVPVILSMEWGKSRPPEPRFATNVSTTWASAVEGKAMLNVMAARTAAHVRNFNQDKIISDNDP
jgi:hypothetical protein